MVFRDDRDALLARNDALEREVDEAKRALAEKERELEEMKHPPRVRAEVTARVDERPRETGRKRTASKSLVARILSVFTRAWVIVVFGLPALFVCIAIVTEPSVRWILAGALAGHAVVVVVVDAYLRRCPSCRRWLAGSFLRVHRDEYDFHVTSWRCAFCDHAWQTSRYAGPR